MRDDNGSLVAVYNTHMLYENDLFDADDFVAMSDLFDKTDGITNVADTLNKPYYDSTAIEDDFILGIPTLAVGESVTHYTYAEAVDLFSCNGKITLSLYDDTVGGYVKRPLDYNTDIVITKYTPVTQGVNNQIILEDVPVTDKYGNKVLNPDGTVAMTQQVKYNVETYSRDNIDEFYIDWDVSARYKVSYRYTDGQIKSEYSAMFVNDLRDATAIYEEVYKEWEESRH